MRGQIAIVIPALDEEESLPRVLGEIPRELGLHVVVVDNGSTDRTADIARELGAHVVSEPRRGYGQACLSGLELCRRLGPPQAVVFLDADGADDPREIPRLLAPLDRNEADLVIGSRVLGAREHGALLPHARFGNALATFLLRVLYSARATDLGPFRAISWPALERIGMRDRDFGWTVEMQARAALLSLRTVEVPVSWRRRFAGSSKISGTVRGTFLAGTKILSTIVRVGLEGTTDNGSRERQE
ncbi:glycosyltransferase family 2 protein [bacterium]|nr:glycosyltransferase family 2 protein [bacterium]